MESSYLRYLIGLLRGWRQGSWLMQWAEPIGGLLVMLLFGVAPFA